ncbi:glycosyltransferase, partial [Variovorax sp. 2RAF20]
RLQALIVLEADDTETIAAFHALDLPAFVQVLSTPPGGPKTKPRACNHALERARGELLVIYDAEDAPDPGQLREAAARFAAGPASLA